MVERRTNLYFNLEDPEQEKAHLFLSKFSRKKNYIVTSLIISFLEKNQVSDINSLSDGDLKELLKKVRDVPGEHQGNSLEQLLQLFGQFLASVEKSDTDVSFIQKSVNTENQVESVKEVWQKVEPDVEEDLPDIEVEMEEIDDEEKDNLNDALLSGISAFYRNS